MDSLCFNDFNVNGSDCPDCFIRDIQLHGYECDANGNLFLKLSFLHTNVQAKKYVVVTNLGNEKIGEYKNNVIVDSVTFREYFVLGPVKSLCDTFLMITIWDLENKVCQSSVIFDSLCCAEKCTIEEISVKELKCNDDNTYQFYLNFTYKNSQSGKFYLNVNDQISGYFSVSQLPLLIKGVKLTDKKVHFIKVCLEDNCCKTREYEVPNCTGDGCIIEEIFIKEMKCNDDNTYQFYLNFTYKNSQSDSFYLSVNNQISGYYSINQLPLLIKGVKFTDKKVHFLKICLENNCCKAKEYEVPNCAGDGCIIEEISIKEMKCTDNHTYQFYLNFTYKNSQSDSFYLSVNGQISGYYSVSQLPLLIKGVKFTDKKVHFLKICLEDNCCKAKEYEVPNCTGDGCIIEDISIKEIKCNDDNTYQFYLNFTYKNSNTNTFDINVNNQIKGTYNVSQLPLKISGIKIVNNGPNDFIKICMDHGACCLTKEYPMPVCGEEACKIYDMTYRPIFDTLSGRYWIMLDFKHLNTSESFYLKGNGKNYGLFNYNTLPLFLGPYFCKENISIEYIISDSKKEACNEVFEPGVILCPALSGTEIYEDSDWYIFSAAGKGNIEIVSGTDKTRDASVEIFNVMGQKVAGDKISDGSGIYELDINNIQTGIYFVKFRTGGKIYTKKIFAGKG
ncbi:MAG: T9SS type A sorting domain-containing protein [Saprospiraceae bacterium]|nr:T9SS type A sorting domain-containing protein [Saprospiraceae bacterium]